MNKEQINLWDTRIRFVVIAAALLFLSWKVDIRINGERFGPDYVLTLYAAILIIMLVAGSTVTASQD